MPWTFYRSTDADAPVLTGEVGKLIALLDACLVNGYSTGPTAKAGAGWTKTHTGTNKAIFQAGDAARARFFIRVDDTATVFAYLRSFETVEDIDNGTNPMPKPTDTVPQLPVIKSASSNSTARPWIIAADDRTVILLVKNGTLAGNAPQYPTHWSLQTFGECISYREEDPYQWILGGERDGLGFGCTLLDVVGATSSTEALAGFYIDRDHIGTPGSKIVAPIFPVPIGSVIQSSQYGNPCVPEWGATNPADNKVWMQPMSFRHWTGGERCVRGELRGLRWALCNSESYNDGDVITDGQGRSWTYYRGRIGFIAAASQTFERACDFLIENNLPPVS